MKKSKSILRGFPAVLCSICLAAPMLSLAGYASASNGAFQRTSAAPCPTGYFAVTSTEARAMGLYVRHNNPYGYCVPDDTSVPPVPDPCVAAERVGHSATALGIGLAVTPAPGARALAALSGSLALLIGIMC